MPLYTSRQSNNMYSDLHLKKEVSGYRVEDSYGGQGEVETGTLGRRLLQQLNCDGSSSGFGNRVVGRTGCGYCLKMESGGFLNVIDKE